MPSSIFSSDGQPGHGPHAPLAPGLRLTASDRPGIAQPVPERDVPPLPWARMLLIAMLLVAALTAAWEWRMRGLGYVVGDLGDDPSAWAEQRRRLDAGAVKVAIVGDSRILFDTDLDRFQLLTGVRPVQLAIAGSNGLPVLEDIADHSRFRGLVIVGITDLSYFRPRPGAAAEYLRRGKFDSPGQRVSLLLSRVLQRHTAMLGEDQELSNWITRTDPNWRAGVQGPHDDVWKVGTFGGDRQAKLWVKLWQDAYLHQHVVAAWMANFGMRKPTPPIIASIIGRTKAAVARIRARGGDVVFVRPPSTDPLHALEEQRLPRSKGWDPMLKGAHVNGVHFLDMPEAQGLTLPEHSHLNPACATVFTDSYVRVVATSTPLLHLAAATPPLQPRDCVQAR